MFWKYCYILKEYFNNISGTLWVIAINKIDGGIAARVITNVILIPKQSFPGDLYLKPYSI